jgi:hypothetical protein
VRGTLAGVGRHLGGIALLGRCGPAAPDEFRQWVRSVSRTLDAVRRPIG